MRACADNGLPSLVFQQEFLNLWKFGSFHKEPLLQHDFTGPLGFTGWALNTVLIFLVHKARQSSAAKQVYLFLNDKDTQLLSVQANNKHFRHPSKSERGKNKNPSSNKVC